MIRVGIDLLWVRPGKNGGTESMARNILQGFLQYPAEDQEYYLYMSEDNAASFSQWTGAERFTARVCPVKSASQGQRVLWENRHLGAWGRRDKLDVWFFPVYSRPLLSGGIPGVTVIHDIQAVHYPEYFSRGRNAFFRLMWRWDCAHSARVATISQYCKKDIQAHYRVPEERMAVVYNPVIVEEDRFDFSLLAERYGIREGGYLYTVSSLAKHKNLLTLLKMMTLLRERGEDTKLLVSGVKVNGADEFTAFIRENRLEERVVYTGFISAEERDSLYSHCRAFLFPSVFEGFGMPPVEAMERGVPVITTKCASLYEVTEGRASYVENPFSPEEWLEKLQHISAPERVHFEGYTLQAAAEGYQRLLRETAAGANIRRKRA